MSTQMVNRASSMAVFVLSLIALLTVLWGFNQPPQRDEGTGAHIFQLSIVLLVPVGLVFLATADWRQPGRSLRPMVFPAVAVVLAFVALYVLEHHR